MHLKSHLVKQKMQDRFVALFGLGVVAMTLAVVAVSGNR
jgi:hypothetical protein